MKGTNEDARRVVTVTEGVEEEGAASWKEKNEKMKHEEPSKKETKNEGKKKTGRKLKRDERKREGKVTRPRIEGRKERGT